jgi:hypothetical protein
MDRQSGVVKMSKARLKLPRCRQPLTRLAAVFIALISFGSGDARTPRYPELSVMRGKTPAGYPYMDGGVTHDEQRAMERLAKIYNLKLVFSRSVGTPVAPDLVMIGANNGGGIDKIIPRGPWFYIQLPPGGYTILARFARQVVLVRNVKLSEGGRATFRLRGD